MKQILRRIKDNEGSVLFSVLLVMTIAVLLGTSALALSQSAFTQTQTEFRTQQAYYNATAALDGIVAYLQTAEEDDPIMQTVSALAEGSSIQTTGSSITGLGDEEVTITKQAGGTVMVQATALYAGATQTVAAYLTGEENLIFDTFFTSTNTDGEVPDNSGWQITGGVKFNQETLPFKGKVTDGDLMNNGNIVFSGGPEVTGEANVIANGDILIQEASEYSIDIEGNVIASGNFKTGHSVRAEKFLVAGDFEVIYSKQIYGDIYVLGDLIVPSGQSPTFHGQIYVGGEVLAPTSVVDPDSVLDLPDEIATEIISATTLSNSYTPWQTDAFMGYEIDVDIADGRNLINQNGTIVSYEPGADDWSVNGSLTIDARASDIYLTVAQEAANASGDFFFGNGVTVEILGENNVFLFLEEGVSFKTQWGAKSMGNSSLEKPNLFIIANHDATIDITAGTNDCTLYGYVYAPNGTFVCSGTGAPNQITGGVVASTLNIAHTSTNFNYIPLDENVLGVGSGAGSSIASYELAGFARPQGGT